MDTAPAVAPLPDHLSTAQVAKLLGIKRETVYAYVSRGLLPRVTIPGRRGSWFRSDQVEALQRNASRPVHSGLAERIRTRITLLTDDAQYYRGLDVRELADTRSFPEVCALLWESGAVHIPVVAENSQPSADPMMRPIDVIRAALGLDAARQTVRGDLSRDGVVRTAGEHIGAAVAALPLLGRPLGRRKHQLDPVTAGLWPRLTRQRADPHRLAVLRAALVLLADHELAASTTAARVAASVRTDISGVMLAALGAMDSPLHGGAPATARRLLQEAVRDPDAVISTHLAENRRPAGFGHLVYREQDPRAEHLLAGIRVLPGIDAHLRSVSTRLVDEWRTRRGWFPNTDFALALFAEATQQRDGAGEAVFTIARLAGWTAHALEEYQEEPMRFRLHAVYVGPRPGDR
ncbi:citrate synthase [Nakamurella sp. A5-74]|uniref:citrate synthase (unknown stereospecificity) n=1 Tax=Nakamurella sp. A5-74 TaxID=3158264 RepID=A0AAU8DJA4_9ACTN